MSYNRPLSPVQIIPLPPDKQIIGNNRCRTCLTTNVILYPIFTPGSEEVQSKELNIITGDMIKVNDGLPQHMCKDCKLSLTIALQFRKTSNRAQETLLKSYKIKTEKLDSEIDGKDILKIPMIPQKNSDLSMLSNLYPNSTLAHLYQQNNIDTINNLGNLYTMIMSANQSTICKPCHPVTCHSGFPSKKKQVNETAIKQILEAPIKPSNIEELKLDLSILDRLGTAVTVCTTPCNKKTENLSQNEPEKSNEAENLTKNLNVKSIDSITVKQELNLEIELNPADYLYDSNECVAENFDVNVKVKLEKLDDDEAVINAENEHLNIPLDKSMSPSNKPTNNKPESHKKPSKTVKKYRPRKRRKLDLNNMRCEQCNRDFTRANSYKDHMRFHEVYVECEICGKRHRNIHALGIHKRTQHNFEWIHKCSYCDYRSSTKEGLVVHERTHTGEKPYICDHCGASFHRRALIVQHVDLHSEKNSECPICEKLFSSKRLVRMHIAKTHKANRYDYQCTVCGITLRYSQSVKKHLLKQHGLPRHLKGLILRVPRQTETQNSGGNVSLN